MNMSDPIFIFLAIYILVVGLCIGSFLNVVALRAFSGESIVLPPSKCPKCHNKLKWYHNIPVLSYVFLGGKCAFCKCKISIQYPIVELANGLLYLASFLVFGISFKTFFACIFVSFLIVISITDIKEQVVFNPHIYSFVGVMFLSSFFNVNETNWLQSLIAIAVAFAGFEIISRIGFLFANSRAFGEGDTYIAMGVGAFLGWKLLIITSVLSVILQALVAIPIMFYNSLKFKKYKMCVALLLCIMSVIMAIVFNFSLVEFSSSGVVLYLTALVLMLGWALGVILKDMRNKKTEELFYMPFGPALAVSAIILMFAQNYVINYLNF